MEGALADLIRESARADTDSGTGMVSAEDLTERERERAAELLKEKYRTSEWNTRY